MSGATPPQPKNRPATLPILTLVLLVVGIGVFAWLILSRQSKPQTTTNAVTAESALSGIPRSYTNFTGTITTIDGQQLLINFAGYNEAGKLYQRVYTVRVAPTTVLLKLQTTAGVRETVSATLDQFQVGDTLAVAGDTNLADLNDFTATKLIRY